MSPPRSTGVTAQAGQASKAEQNARQLALLVPRRGRSPADSRRRDSRSGSPPSREVRLVPAEPSALAVWTGSQGTGSKGSKGSAKGGGKGKGQTAAYSERSKGKGKPFDTAKGESKGGKKGKSKQPRSRHARSIQRAKEGPSFQDIAANIPKGDGEISKKYRRRVFASLRSGRSKADV